MKNLYRPRLKDLSDLSKSSSKAKVKRPSENKSREIKIDWKKFSKIAVLGVLVLAVALHVPPQIQKFKMRRGEARRQAEAEKRGVNVLESELIGLVPLEAMVQVAAHALQLPALKAEQVVEMKLFGE